MSQLTRATRKQRRSLGIEHAPVAPGRVPFLGHALAFRDDPLSFLTSLSALGPFVKVYLGPQVAYAVTSPALVHQMLVRDAAAYDKGRLFDKLKSLTGNGLITASGDFHLRQRRLMSPVFHRPMMARYAETILARTSEMMSEWSAGAHVDLQRAANDLTLRIGVSTLFSSMISKAAVNELEECLPVVLRGILARTVLPDVVFRAPVPAFRRYDEAETRIREVIDELIRAYRADGRNHGDVLSLMLSVRDDETGHAMTDEEIRDEVLTLVLAAAETTSSVLASVFYRLSEHPDVLARVTEELDLVLQGRPIGLEDVARLEYLQQVLHEVLRLDMPADMFMRRSVIPTRLGDVDIPSGTELLFSIPALHRDSTVYPDPERFDPDRWSETTAARRRPPGSYLPFGAGIRGCIGRPLALVELAVIAGTVLSRWRFSAPPGFEARRLHRITTHFDTLIMTAWPRT
jgi:cytochrome P450